MSRNARAQFILLALLLLTGRLRAAESLPAPASAATARVVLVQGQNLLSAYLPDNARVEAAFNRGLTQFTHSRDAAAAWLALVTTNDTVGIKVFSTPGPLCGTRPAVVAAMVRGLLAAGLPQQHILIWDKHAEDLRSAGFFALGEALGVRVAGAMETGYDENSFYLPDSPVIGALLWGDLEFGKKEKDPAAGKKSFVAKLVSRQMTKIISVAPLINENNAGVCGHLFSLALGSVDNTRRFEANSGERLARALAEINALPVIGDRVVLHVTDALLGQSEGGPASYLQFSTVLNQLWFSHDPVALDLLAAKELEQESKLAGRQFRANQEIFNLAALLQLGVNEPNRIYVEKVR